jgi:hypothetical protein
MSNCGKWNNDQYEVNKEQYPKCFNESKGYTMDEPIGIGKRFIVAKIVKQNIGLVTVLINCT